MARFTQTKNTQIDNFECDNAGSGQFEYGVIINFAGSKEQSVNVHGAGAGPAGVIISGREGTTFQTGDRVDVQFDGVVKIKLAAAVLKGAKIASNGIGLGETWTSVAKVNVGTSLEAGAAGSYVSVRLNTNSQ